MQPCVLVYGRLRTNVGVVSTWRALHGEMLPRWSKTVLQEGRGLYRPSELATVKVDVVGRYCTTDGCSEDVFDRREGVSMKIGNQGHFHRLCCSKVTIVTTDLMFDHLF